MLVLKLLYGFSTLGLAIVGFNALILSLIYLLHRRSEISPPSVEDGDLPSVVVQLPIYNEQYVVETLIGAICKLDYPCDRLTIQVLDDSTDETVDLAAAAVERARSKGYRIEHVRRETREGFKAGALAYGLTRTDAEFVVIFDADFVPRPDFLRQVIPYFLGDEKLGMVQARWSHLNADYSILTRAQALALDAHFAVEQTARHRGGLMMNFSGTAGVWRRTCIEESGGWHHDTLSEDIDLSYRAQLAGWRMLYLPDVDAPAEIPPLMMGFKRQQSRWATGTVQCLRKLGGTVLRSHLSVWQKVQACIHLGGYFIHPLMVVVLLLTLPLVITDQIGSLPIAGLGLAMIGPPIQTLIAQRRLHKDWLHRLFVFPLFMLLGLGIAVSNTEAVLKGFSSRQYDFRRTPKFHVHAPGQSWASSTYILMTNHTTWIEIVLALYAAVTAVFALRVSPAVVPFMALYAIGFIYVAGLGLLQARTARRIQARQEHTFSLYGTGR